MSRTTLAAAGMTCLAFLVLGVTVATPLYGQRPRLDERERGERAAGPLEMLVGRGSELGVSVRDLEQADAAREKLSTVAGVLIDEVRAESPAARAGVRRGDVLVEFDGEKVRSTRQFTRLVQETPAGRNVKIGIMRAGRRSEIHVTLDRSSVPWFDREQVRGSLERLEDLGRDVGRNFRFKMEELDSRRAGRGRLGLGVENLNPQLAEYFGAKGVLVTNVVEDSPAAKAGLKAGDVISTINARSIGSTSELMKALRDIDDGEEVSVGIVRNKQPMAMKVTPERPRRSRVTHSV